MILGRKRATAAACTQNPTLCSDRKMDRPVPSTWRFVCSAFAWLLRRQRPQGWEILHLLWPSACHRSSVRIPQEQPQLGGFNWQENKNFLLVWAQHRFFPAQKSICPILHLRNKERAKGWLTWPGVRPRTHLNWWRACSICSQDSRLSLQGNSPEESILIASARSYSPSVSESADFLPNQLW